MFQKIYIPVDNSDVSDKVLDEALKLAKSNGAKVRVTHIVNLEQITFGIEMVGLAELKDALMNIGKTFIEQVQ